jgi:hypothetical protein
LDGLGRDCPRGGGGGGTVSADLIPDGTDRIRPNAAATMNTMTTPSAEKKPSCSMIRM